MMNAELSAVGDARIVIPNVYRNEYIGGLRRVSTSNGDIGGFLAVMVHAWRWTAAMPWTERAATDGQLDATYALFDSTDARKLGCAVDASVNWRGTEPPPCAQAFVR